MNYLNTCTN